MSSHGTHLAASNGMTRRRRICHQTVVTSPPSGSATPRSRPSHRRTATVIGDRTTTMSGDAVLKGFRDFITKGNVIDLAVAVVIGAAFIAVVNAVVEGLITR